MIGKLPDKGQQDLFRPRLENFIDMDHNLVRLANKIDWKRFECLFSVYYSDKGAPGVPIRLIVACFMLQYIYDVSYRALPGIWKENPYFQYFSGSVFFEYKFPFDSSAFAAFRKRIGNKGIEAIYLYIDSLIG